MTVLSVVTTKQQFGNDTLSITARNVSGEPDTLQAALIVKTVSLWLYLRKLIDAGERTSPLDKTPEMAVSAGNNITFETWNETRVTVFDWSNHYGLTVHSDTMAQNALDVYWGMQDALKQLREMHPADAPQAPQTSAPSAAATSAPEAQESGVTRVSGKKEAKALANHTRFIMPIAQVAAVMSRDGKLTWELYGFYGGKAGQYADMLVYEDNEIAIKSGLVGRLAEIVNKAGSAATGNWIVSGSVGEKNDKKSLYVHDIAETEAILEQYHQQRKAEQGA